MRYPLSPDQVRSGVLVGAEAVVVDPDLLQVRHGGEEVPLVAVSEPVQPDSHQTRRPVERPEIAGTGHRAADHNPDRPATPFPPTHTTHIQRRGWRSGHERGEMRGEVLRLHRRPVALQRPQRDHAPQRLAHADGPHSVDRQSPDARQRRRVRHRRAVGLAVDVAGGEAGGGRLVRVQRKVLHGVAIKHRHCACYSAEREGETRAHTHTSTNPSITFRPPIRSLHPSVHPFLPDSSLPPKQNARKDRKQKKNSSTGGSRRESCGAVSLAVLLCFLFADNAGRGGAGRVYPLKGTRATTVSVVRSPAARRWATARDAAGRMPGHTSM